MIKYIEIKQPGDEKGTFLYFGDWLNHSDIYHYLVRQKDTQLISAGFAQRYGDLITHSGNSFTLKVEATKDTLLYYHIHGCIVREGLMCSNSPSLLKRLAQVCETEADPTLYSLDQMEMHITEDDSGCQFNCRVGGYCLSEY